MHDQIISSTKNLMLAFNTEQGLPQSVYDATYDLVAFLFGQKGIDLFVNSIDATDDLWYVREDCIPFWEQNVMALD